MHHIGGGLPALFNQPPGGGEKQTGQGTTWIQKLQDLDNPSTDYRKVVMLHDDCRYLMVSIDNIHNLHLS